MIQQLLLNKYECTNILSFKNNATGYSNIKKHDRDYCEWLIDSNNFDFILPKLLQFGIQSLPDARIIKYNKGNYFSPHRDQYELHSERYKTLIIQLNDTYDGGELIVNNIAINKTIGNTIMFDSNAIHSVSEIKNGIRYSLVFWLEYIHFKNKNVI